MPRQGQDVSERFEMKKMIETGEGLQCARDCNKLDKHLPEKAAEDRIW